MGRPTRRGSASELEHLYGNYAFVAIVVLTMLKQAFAFKAIQFLEGCWGTNSMAEWLARRR